MVCLTTFCPSRGRLRGLADQTNRSKSGSASPPTVRPAVCQAIAIRARAGVKMLVGGAGRPSGRTPFALMSHWSPSSAGHEPLGEAPRGVEDPRAELLLERGVPADPLGAAEHDLALDLHVEVARTRKLPSSDQRAGRGHDGVVALVDPIADHPFEVLQVVMGTQFGGD